MAGELEAHIAAAAIEGDRPSSVVGEDVRAFATEWANERGVTRPRLMLGITMAAALVGALPGVFFALFAAYGLQSPGMAELLGGEMTRVAENAYQPTLSPPEWLLLLLYAVGAVVAYAGALAAASAALRWRLDPAVARTTRSLAIVLPASFIAAVGAAIVYSSTTGFSTDPSVVATDVLVATSAVAATVAIVRFTAVRHERAALAHPSV
jgi:hypothetical protein